MSAIRFLIDENLSILLPATAHERGYQAVHVNHKGLHQSKDWDILRVIEEEDWVLVTNNVIEFRGRYRRLDLHPGVVFLLQTVPRAKQIELFSAVLDVIADFPDMINIAIDVTYVEGNIRVNRYALP